MKAQTILQTGKDVAFYSVITMMVASATYYATTRNLPTPFGDSITEEQKMFKKQSAKTRRNHYVIGMGLGAVVAGLIYWYVDRKHQGKVSILSSSELST